MTKKPLRRFLRTHRTQQLIAKTNLREPPVAELLFKRATGKCMYTYYECNISAFGKHLQTLNRKIFFRLRVVFISAPDTKDIYTSNKHP